MSESYDISVGVSQGSALSPVLSGLYLAQLIYKWAGLCQQSLGQSSSHTLIMIDNSLMQFYVNDGQFVVSSPDLNTNAIFLRWLFRGFYCDIIHAGLKIDVGKTEVMHFFSVFFKDPWSLEFPLGPLVSIDVGTEVIWVLPKEHMRYLSFILDRNLSFKEHIRLCINKAHSLLLAL